MAVKNVDVYYSSLSVRPEENFCSNLLRKKFVSKGKNKIEHILKKLLKHEFIASIELKGNLFLPFETNHRSDFPQGERMREAVLKFNKVLLLGRLA